MKILMINKFLYPNGGSETYIFQLGDYLKSQGHEVQYFGMEHEERCVGNAVNAYTSNMDFHGGSKLSKLTYPIKTIYSSEARKKLRLVLDDFKPDVCHINNFNYQLTPSIILEIVRWRKKTGRGCRIVYTAHDYQLVCPNHMCNNPNTHENCEKCFGGHFGNCIKGKCIHGSTAKSVIGAMEACFWKKNGAYRYIDKIICISEFQKGKLGSDKMLQQKIVVIPNFTEKKESGAKIKENYILYFGRYTQEKGVLTLLKVCEKLPEVPFVFAGAGLLEPKIDKIKNVKNVGFVEGDKLDELIAKALFVVAPSEWYEPFGLSVVEAIALGTPVLGANIGDIPELVQGSGLLFESGSAADLEKKILYLFNNEDEIDRMSKECSHRELMSIQEYYKRILPLYGGN